MEKESYVKLLVFLVCVVAVLSIVSIAIASNSRVDEQALADKVTAQVTSKIKIPTVPTAAEIAAQIPPVVVPEIKAVDNSKVNDLWENLYSDQIDELKTNAYDVAVAKLEDHDYKVLEKYLEANVAGFDEITDVEIKDFEVTVVNLGLDEDEDKTANVDFEVKVWYSLLEGSDNNFKKTLNVTADVVFNQGDFEDEDVVLTVK